MTMHISATPIVRSRLVQKLLALFDISGIVEALRARRAARAMLSLDDRMLRDMGLTREDVAFALDAPLNVDPTLRLCAMRRYG